MNNNKQSSIEYLAKELNSLSFDYLVGQVSNKEHGERYDKILEQAKAMHKQESINLTKHWYNQWEQGKGMTISEYYDQEFNNK